MPCVKQLGLTLMGLLMLTLTGCWPTEAQKAKGAEEQRIRCLDTQCEGDVVPKRNSLTQEILKINGQWYVGPSEYYSSGINGANFYWWEGKPMSRKTQKPKQMQALFEDGKSSEVSITIFFTGRQRWPNPTIEKPWEGAGWEGRFLELQREGLKIQRQQVNPELERVRFFDATGKPYRHEYYLASQQTKRLGQGRPGIACDFETDVKFQKYAGCTGGFYWNTDLYADFRLHAKHAQDWPAIHQEIIRVLNLAKKVQP